MSQCFSRVFPRCCKGYVAIQQNGVGGPCKFNGKTHESAGCFYLQEYRFLVLSIFFGYQDPENENAPRSHAHAR